MTQQLRRHWHWLCLAALLLVLEAGRPLTTGWLEYDRSLVTSGQWWRLLTAHLVHLTPSHMLGNLAGLALVAWILRDDVSAVQFAMMLVWCGLVVGLGLHVMAMDLYRYVGLSGVLHGLMLVAPFWSRGYGVKTALVFAVLISAKVLWEQSSGYDDQAMAELIGGRVEARAHLLGWLAGGVMLGIVAVWRKIQQTTETSDDH